MPRKKKDQDTAPPLLSSVKLSPEGQIAYAQYWEAFAAASDLAPSQTATRGARTTGASAESRFPLLACSPQPFVKEGGFISAHRILELCIKAYWCQGFALWRATVEKMVELSSSDILLTGSSKKTKDFVHTWLKQIGARKLSRSFHREYWRSANVFVLALNAKIKQEDLKALNSLYSGVDDTIPLRYTILEPTALKAKLNINYDNPLYYRVYSPEEVARLKTPITPEDKAIVESLSPEAQKMIKQGGAIILPIDPENLHVTLAKCQDYEPFAVPAIWNALQQVEMKLALQNMDKIIASMGERLFLLVNVGYEPNDKNGGGINYNTMAHLQQIFNSGAVQRVLVVDGSVKMEWKTLPINELLSADKYKQVDADLKIALNSIFWDSSEKFANTSIKVNIFVESLKEARSAFLEFLQSQIDLVCKKINSKSAPTVSFSEIDLRDQNQYERFIQSMASVGLLTAEEVFEALDTGRLPNAEESEESQKRFKQLKDEGLYQALVGNSVALQAEQMKVNKELGIQKLEQDKKAAAAPGRPIGTKAPQTTKKQTPIGASADDEYSFASLKDISWKVSALQDEVDAALKKKFKIKQLNETQNTVAREITQSIISNEEVDAWGKSVKAYIKAPKEINESVMAELAEIGEKNGISIYAAAMLRLAAV